MSEEIRKCKLFEMQLHGECPECGGAFTEAKVTIPIEHVMVGRIPTPSYPVLAEEKGYVLLDCPKNCRLGYVPFRAYLRAYHEVLCKTDQASFYSRLVAKLNLVPGLNLLPGLKNRRGR